MAASTIRPASPDDLDVLIDFNARLAEETEGKRLDPGVLARGVASALDDPDRLPTILRTIRRVEQEPSLLGSSPHLLVIARKPAPTSPGAALAT